MSISAPTIAEVEARIAFMEAQLERWSKRDHAYARTLTIDLYGLRLLLVHLEEQK